MNGGPEYTKAMIERGMPSALTEAIVRYLGEEDQVPRLRRGRPSLKKQDATWDPSHYAIALLAFGTSLPINAREVAQTLGPYKWVRTTKHRVVRNEAGQRTGVAIEEDTQSPNGIELRASLARLVIHNASKTSAYRQEVLAVLTEHAITLSVDGGTASISYHSSDDHWMVDHYVSPIPLGAGSDQRIISGRKVSVELPFSLVVVCGGLLADTWEKTGRLLALPGDGNASPTPDGDVPTENENAPGLAGPRAPVREKQPHANAAEDNQSLPATRMSDTLKTTEFGIGFQSHSVACVRRPLINQKDALHHAQGAQL